MVLVIERRVLSIRHALFRVRQRVLLDLTFIQVDLDSVKMSCSEVLDVLF
jgi:hypothetical protein